ncbi:DUF2007 domain-containing protein [Candidatus Thioglobus sp.]|nr:DUF2007 domain-containing protein [Candidatus Thioglobus sp.]
MKLVYTHENRLIVLNVRNILSDHGIEVVLNNEYASSAAGGLAPIDTWPEVWIANDDDFGSSMKIIDSLDVELMTVMWQCRECLEKNDETFDYCWNCKRDRS